MTETSTEPARGPATFWRVLGTLTLTTPMHVGTGTWRDFAASKREGSATAAEVARDHAGRPYLPGSSLKGAIGAWLRRRIEALPAGRGAGAGGVAALLGRGPATPREGRRGSTEDDGAGGVAAFLDAFIDGQPTPKPTVPYYGRPDQPPGTGTAVSVVIDRASGAAAPGLLAHRDIVPPGTRFRVEVRLDRADADAVALVLAALGGFADRIDPITLGADGGTGHGRATWALDPLDGVHVIRKGNAAGLLERLAAGGEPFGGAETRLPEAELARLTERATARATALATPPVVSARLRLAFDGAVLVRDPSREAGKAPADGAATADRESDPARPVARSEGGYVLPGESVRGALRSRAERIVRTVRVAKGGSATEDIATEDPIGLLFGATDRRGALALEALQIVGEGVEAQQEFIAVDRFTGGVAGGRKFAAVALWQPTFEGTARLDLTRLIGPKPAGTGAGDAAAKDGTTDGGHAAEGSAAEGSAAEGGVADDRADGGVLPRPAQAALGLLALVVRDLIDGDVTFGSGAAKGYGVARIDPATLAVGALAETLTLPADRLGLPATADGGIDWQDDGVRAVVRGWVEAFRADQAERATKDGGTAGGTAGGDEEATG